jgi:hypothetical protein
VRIRIQEPKINDWLPYERIETLRNAGLDMEAMANPVLLSYLRCIDIQSFAQVSGDPEKVVQSYFEYMLERERERQDLRMTTDMQSGILRRIAGDMLDKGYTAEEREYIIRMMLEKCYGDIDLARNQYPSTDRPTREEIANKLASHALLDRSSVESTKIGFVNDFSLGNYVAENMLSDPDWLGDDLRFIEPAVKSYLPRAASSKEILFHALVGSFPYLDAHTRIDVSAELLGVFPHDLSNDSVDGVELSHIEIGSSLLASFQFNESVFKNCTFNKAGLSQVTFLNCKFFDCEVLGAESTGPVYVLGGVAPPELIAQLDSSSVKQDMVRAPDRERLIERAILRRFWPAGDPLDQKPSRPIYKPMKYLCHPNDEIGSVELYAAVERLLESGVLLEMSRSNLIALNAGSLDKAYDLFKETE